MLNVILDFNDKSKKTIFLNSPIKPFYFYITGYEKSLLKKYADLLIRIFLKAKKIKVLG